MRYYDVICSYIEILIRPYDVTLIYAAYAKCKIQMAYAAYAKIQNTNDFFKEKVRKEKPSASADNTNLSTSFNNCLIYLPYI